MKFTPLRPSDLIVHNIEVSVSRVSALCTSVMKEGCFYSTLLNSISSNPYRLHWWSLSVLLSVLDFLSLVLVESEWLVVYLFTLLREFKMSRRRQHRQRQKSNRLRLCSHYSVNSIGPGRHKSITHIERRVSAVGREGSVHWTPVLIPEYLLSSQWVPVLAPTCLFPRLAE